MATEKVTVEVTTEELAELKTYLALRQFCAKSGMPTWGLAEELLARIVFAGRAVTNAEGDSILDKAGDRDASI